MNKNNFDFSGKTAIVTGSTRGIGKSIADLLSECGCEVTCTGTKSEEPMLLNNQVYVPLDFLDDESIAQFVSKVSGYKSIDILVNNAGINIISPIHEVKQEDWEKILKVNLTGSMMLMKEVSKIMKKNNKGGKILNISSIFGIVSREMRNAYSSTKAGLIGLTRASSLDLAPDNILVNALCPGFTKTDMTASILSSSDMETLCEKIPMGRFAEEIEIAKAALFLCSDMNTYMTGQTLIADGGFVIQ